MTSRVLVIGSSGFIGTALCDQLLAKGYDVTGIDIKWVPESSLLTRFVEHDYVTYPGIKSLIEDVSLIFHLSSSMIPVTSNKFPLRDIDENLKGTLNLLDVLKDFPEKRLVFVSSGGTVYGEAKYLPIRETHETNPLCSYGIVKLAIEKYINMYSRLYNLNYQIFRLSNPYGTKQLDNNGQGLIANLILRIQNNDTVTIWGDGTIIRDYIYIDDAIDAMLAGMNYEGEEKVFNLSYGKGYSTNKMIKIIEEILNKRATVNYIESRSFDVQANILDISKIRRCLNWSPKIGIGKGVEKTIIGKHAMNKYYCKYSSV